MEVSSLLPSSSQWAVIAQGAWAVPVVLLAYQLLIDFVPLAPFNDVTVVPFGKKVGSFLMNYAPLLLIAFALHDRSRTGVMLSTLGCFLYLLGHLNAWWRPYFFGATNKELTEYQALFQRTFKILPKIGTNPVPDVQHMILGVIVLTMTVATAAVWLSQQL